MTQRIQEWSRRASRLSWLAGVVLVPGVRQEAAAQTGNVNALVIVAVALLGPVVLGAGAAFVIWLISRGTPPAAVGAEPPKSARPREVLPPGVHMPAPSLRPFLVGLGVMVMSFGVVLRGIAIPLSDEFSIPIVLVIGLGILAWGLLGWVFDDYRAAKKSH